MSGLTVARANSTDLRVLGVKSDDILGASGMFLRDAEALRCGSWGGQYLLITYSIELALKGYLYRSGFKLSELTDFGQDLSRLLNLARRNGLTTSHAVTDNILFRLKQAAGKAA